MNYIVQGLQVVDSDEMKSSETIISKAYHRLTEIFLEIQTETLPPHHKGNYAIELLKETTLPFEPMYNLSVKELEVLHSYLDTNLENGFIQPSQSFTGAPVLFALKSDGGLQLCVNYHELNAIIKKNQYPLPLIDKIMNCVSGAKVFTKIDIKNTYYHIHICEGDEWKIAFHTQYRLYEYLVMLFSLINTSVSFQSYIHGVLHQYLNIFTIVFLNDILIYFINESQHEQHVQTVLQALLTAELFVKLFKCLFSVK